MQSFIDTVGTWFGAIVVGVLTAAGGTLYQYFRKPSSDKVIVYLGQTGPDTAGYRTAAQNRLAGKPGVEVVTGPGPLGQGKEPDLFVGVYGDRNEPAAAAEFDAVPLAPDGRRQLWMLELGKPYETPSRLAADSPDDADSWTRFRDKVQLKNPDLLPSTCEKFADQVVAEVDKAWQAKFPAKAGLNPLDPLAFLTGGAVAVAAAIIYAIWTGGVGDWGAASLILLLAVGSGVAGYLFQVVFRWALR
ncbi:hypothetical protein [Paractinoplanes lichenicola]|uniref:Uncharacterized protein n=1 Tax=Paractinoplanes lichenicola TaxID=2802976 RepID=A0ABS1VWE4_9ACTN|nr:hypothetical protein [Actinoplanes lichenicola]MBL7258814.1 hypothetical protein [Actinoplanes lichenicola]